jgi:hypothetical protein
MKKLRRRIATVGALATLAGVFVTVLNPGFAGGGEEEPANKVLARALAIQQGEIEPTKFDLPLSGGVMQALDAQFGEDQAAAAAFSTSSSSFAPPHRSRDTNGCPNMFRGRGNRPDNIRVNQDCTLRRQAEEWVGVNPTDFDNVLAGQNDSVIGFNHCGYDWSLNRGDTWGSVGTAPPPFSQELFQTLDTADACSDPVGTFDHLGNAYITGVFFDVADSESAIWVAKSNAPIKGRFYHIPDDSDPFQEYKTDVMGEPVNDNDPAVFHDKELMIADSRPNSLKAGRVYVTWTRFLVDLEEGVVLESPIYFSQSTDGGATWSAPIEISGSNPAICTFAGPRCKDDQGSHPVVGPDGTVYVIFGNANTPEPGMNQVLIVKCPPANECDDPADWTAPVKVGDLIGTHPIGDPGNAGGCPVGSQCLPPNGYRAPEFTSMTISVDKNSNLYATWADHRNGDDPSDNCGPFGAWSTRTPPCDHDIFFAFSTDGGATWSPTVTVTPRSRLGKNAQWQPWSDVAGDGNKLYVGFYDRQYGSCEFTGCNDITLATIRDPRSASPRIRYRRITTDSMPNLVPANNPVQAGFLGDYMWVEVSRHNFNQKDVHIVWADTRPLFGTAPEEDIYYAQIDGDDNGDD